MGKRLYFCPVCEQAGTNLQSGHLDGEAVCSGVPVIGTWEPDVESAVDGPEDRSQVTPEDGDDRFWPERR